MRQRRIETSGGGGEGKTGGDFTIAYSSQPDFLDPALSYTVDGWAAMWNVYLPPIGYKHEEGEEGSELTPMLAEELPKASEGGKVYTFTFRDGHQVLRRHAAQGQRLRAHRQARAQPRVRRRLLLREDRGHRGVRQGQGPAKADISGIETDDKTGEVKVTLTEPDGTFPAILGLNFSGVVPSEHAVQEPDQDARRPAPGAYKITTSEPNREFVLEKNKNFEPIDGVPEGKADTLTFKIIKSLNRAAQDTISGELDSLHDPPPADLPARDQGEVLGPLQELHHAVHVLLLPEREARRRSTTRRRGRP